MSFLARLVWTITEGWKNLSWGNVIPATPKEKFLDGVWVFVHVLRVRYDLPSSINFGDINGSPNWGPITLISGYLEGPKWYH